MTLLAQPRDQIKIRGDGAEQLTRADTVRSELTSIQLKVMLSSFEILLLTDLNKACEKIAVGISEHTEILCLGSIHVYQW